MVILDMQRYAFIFNSQEDYCLLSVDSPPARLPPSTKANTKKEKKGATPMLHLFICHLFLTLLQCPLVIFFGDGVGIIFLVRGVPRAVFENIFITGNITSSIRYSRINIIVVF